ncbi:hypothetical protein COU60_02610 [Candidatus Pacearchaeota archaeon CG10_big_fil_rev_8_21_14_0_10_34_76]|nr:MAG: hypothetical protein COU60_02610 [Candidatus Pacearchaeota archaeon CG10_big_fil_rev_8_21_14_0_10_34_76]
MSILFEKLKRERKNLTHENRGKEVYSKAEAVLTWLGININDWYDKNVVHFRYADEGRIRIEYYSECHPRPQIITISFKERKVFRANSISAVKLYSQGSWEEDLHEAYERAIVKSKEVTFSKLEEKTEEAIGELVLQNG